MKGSEIPGNVSWVGDAHRMAAVLGEAPQDAAARVLRRATRYVEIETPSRDVAALVQLAELVEKDLAALGAKVTRHDAPGLGRNLVADAPGLDAGPVLLAVAHIDTVHPAGTLGTMPVRADGDCIRGPGLYDMKIGLALIVEALATLAAAGRSARRTVRVFVTCDEEIGSHSSRPLFAAAAPEAVAALVPEPCIPDGSVKTRRKGVATYQLEITGRAAHAGVEPEKAASAITELAHQLPAILALADHPRGTTINVGVIRGGTASNVVAAAVSAEIDARAWEPHEAERVRLGLEALAPHDPRATVTVRRTEHRGPLVRTPAVAGLAEHACKLAADLGFTMSEGSSGGGSDGSLLSEMGVPVLDGLGPQGGGAHSVDEHILLSDLPFRLALMVRLMETL